MKTIILIQPHDIFSHVGNSESVFPIQRMGLEVWLIKTVQKSNSTQYQQRWGGQCFSADAITGLIQCLDNIPELEGCGALISGYQGTVEQCDAVVQAVKKVKQCNSQAMYVCAPVMGGADKGCIVSEEIKEKLVNQLMPMADVLVLSQYELAQFTGVEIYTQEDAMTACKVALELGAGLLLVKNVPALSFECFSMILATPKVCYLAQMPRIKCTQQSIEEAGDLIAGLFTASLVKGMALGVAFKHTFNALYGALKVTEEQGTRELKAVLAQMEFTDPSHDLPIIKLA